MEMHERGLIWGTGSQRSWEAEKVHCTQSAVCKLETLGCQGTAQFKVKGLRTQGATCESWSPKSGRPGVLTCEGKRRVSQFQERDTFFVLSRPLH